MVGGAITGPSWRRSVGGFGPAHLGVTCHRISLPGKRFGGVSIGGPRTAPGTGCLRLCRVRRMPQLSWSGRCRWTPRSRGHISMRLGPEGWTQGAWSNHKNLRAEPDDHGLGRSRGGWTTKAHLSVDRVGRPLSVLITAGQCGDNPQLLPVLDLIGVPGRGARARVRSRPQRVLADKAYSHPSTRNALRERGIGAVIPEKSDQIARRKAKGRNGGRPPSFDAEAYKERNVVERAFNRLKQWRGVATRYDKHARNYRAGIVVASILIWLR